jgi:hypothetical protein
MHFYVDETGHTGPNLFDPTQPVLSYGVLSSPADLDKVAESELAALRKKLGVPRIHAAELGIHHLSEVVDCILVLQKKHRIRFEGSAWKTESMVTPVFQADPRQKLKTGVDCSGKPL